MTRELREYPEVGARTPANPYMNRDHGPIENLLHIVHPRLSIMSALPISELTVNKLPVCEGPVLLRDQDEIVPPVPETIDDAGLSESIIEQLILKNLFFRSEILGRELASLVGFKFSLIEQIMESFKHQHLVQVKRSLGMGNASSVFTLSEAGRNMAREFLELNQYTGPAPVPLYQYLDSGPQAAPQTRMAHARESRPHVSKNRDHAGVIGASRTRGGVRKLIPYLWAPGNGKTYLARHW